MSCGIFLIEFYNTNKFNIQLYLIVYQRLVTSLQSFLNILSNKKYKLLNILL